MDTFRNILFALTWIIAHVKCDSKINTPPVIRVDERYWRIPETEEVGTVITHVKSYDGDNDPLEYGLEPIHGNWMPFRIDKNTGAIRLNESLKGKAGKEFGLYVTVSDGKLAPKSEVYVKILNSTVNDYQYSRIPTPVFPATFGQPPSIFQQKTYPQEKNRTFLVPIDHNFVSTQKIVTTTTTVKSTTDLETEINANGILPVDLPVKSEPDLTTTLVPVVSVCAIFLAVGLIALVFRKKICLGKTKISKEDMKKDSNGIGVQGDIDMQQWRGPRAFSNRYEPWERDAASSQPPQLMTQLSTTSSAFDRWEFQRYRLKFFNILGEGAFGQVWKCEALDIEGKDGLSVVAVKTLKENATEKERSDLVSELQVMKMLEPHPNVVRLLACCTDKDPLFVIMEYVSGGKLQSYLRNSRAERCYNNMHGQSKSLTSRDLTLFVYQVAKGMEFLSSKGIIHRDLAARNVLIAEDHTCKVADFGFARDVIDSHVYERKTEGKLPIRWMAPESLYDNVYTTKSDVWSFGVLLWEVVTLGSTPYPGLSAVEVMKKVRDGHRLDKPEHCRRELYNIMYYCWDKDPKQRPCFGECLELLEKLLTTETDYIELERFPDHSYYNMLNLSDEKL